MRKQIRPPEPQVLQEHAAKWNAEWSRKVRVKRKSSKHFNWRQRNNQSVRDLILPALRSTNQEHCSFCDAYPLLGQSLEPIEHFKPKITFPEDAYSWSNLYYACEYCQNAKGNDWNQDLLRPDADDYLFNTYFDFDYTTGQLRANLAAKPEHQIQARVTIEMYGLDLIARRTRRRENLRAWQRDPGGEIDFESDRDFLENAI